MPFQKDVLSIQVGLFHFPVHENLLRLKLKLLWRMTVVKRGDKEER